MSLKVGNLSFQANKAQNWLWMGKYGTNMEQNRSHEAQYTAQPSVHPLSAVLEIILASLQLASSCLQYASLLITLSVPENVKGLDEKYGFTAGRKY